MPQRKIKLKPTAAFSPGHPSVFLIFSALFYSAEKLCSIINYKVF